LRDGLENSAPLEFPPPAGTRRFVQGFARHLAGSKAPGALPEKTGQTSSAASASVCYSVLAGAFRVSAKRAQTAGRSILERNPVITTIHPIRGAEAPETFSDAEYATARLLLSLLSLVVTTTPVVLLQVNG
jgi:hypothetical protein